MIATITNKFLVIEDEGTKVALLLGEARKLREFLNSKCHSLRPHKNWEACWNETHPDDCNCRNNGGET